MRWQTVGSINFRRYVMYFPLLFRSDFPHLHISNCFPDRHQDHSSDENPTIPPRVPKVFQSSTAHTFAPCPTRRLDLRPGYHCYSCLWEATNCVITLAVHVHSQFQKGFYQLNIQIFSVSCSILQIYNPFTILHISWQLWCCRMRKILTWLHRDLLSEKKRYLPLSICLFG